MWSARRMKFWFSKMLVPYFFCKLWFTHKLSALMELCWHIFMHSLTLPLIPCLATKVHCFSKHFFFQIHFAEDNIQCCWLNIVVRYFKSLVHSQDSPWTFLRVDERQLQKGSLLSVDWNLLCGILCSLRGSYIFWIIKEHETAVFPLWKTWCFTLDFRKIL